MTVLWLLLGLGLVIFGGDLFVRAAVGLAEILRLPRIIIGGTLMSLATTSPEIAVSVMSGLRGEPGLAVGNAIGSVMANVGLIAGTLGVITLVRVHRRDVLDAMVMMTVTALVLLMASVGGEVVRWEGWMLTGMGLLYFSGDLLRNLLDRRKARQRDAETMEELHRPPTQSAWATGLLFAAGAALVVLGSRLLVENGVLLAERMGISPLVIGATVVAVGTSLPEYTTAIMSARRGVADLSIGNVIGANVANLTLVAGSAALFSTVRLSQRELYLNFPAMFIVFAVIGYALLARGQLGRWMGMGLLAIYAAYVAGVVWGGG